MNSSTDRYEYSTLEVDTEAQNRNLEESARAAQAPEVNQNATEHLNYPEVVAGGAPKADIDNTLPEPVQTPEKEVAGAGAVATAAPPKICGIQRKFFWALLGAVAMLIAIVVGVTAGVVASRKSTSSESASSDDSADSTSNATSLYANTNLATANFTDGLGNENYLVVYQLNNKAIYMSAWNSSRKSWVVSPIVDGKTNNLGFDSVRKGTALSLDVFAYSDSSRDLHVYWQLPDSGGLATIKALTYNAAKGVSTQSTLPAANWVDSAAGNSYISTAGSSLVSYGKQCDLCNQYTYLYWQTTNGIREASYQNASSGWYSDNSVIQVSTASPSENSSLAQAYVAAATTDGHRSMNIFYRATTSALTQIVNGDGRYVGAYLGRDIGPKTNIAAFSTGFNETSSNITDKLGFQVLTMDPAASNGVQLTYYKGSSWTASSTQVEALSDCRERGTMVANHARRVYCLVSNGTGVEIVEYAWLGDPDDTSTYSNYTRIGTVDITAS
ncbi:uncharacterized protein GGS22DRAFT_158255 [Annulohypoxylon maeteangense]|uniref:uncharacterized protein n=1 Tax=Annulohypoxylon maeteangense TaxID=1927788 RepID=UPI002008B942|nr:uncharacterized protein GGS22DRAFT_158255 [Annulohypoxylon maeteangense]KAI0886611.1 hypothetical protein GGS22DRAFT_158255 [Annulohypoxylon maeteangense]